MRPSDFDVSHRFATINGIRMHYVEKGREGAPLVVLLHGFPEFWWSWRYQIDPLARAGFRVIAPDLRGYNETDKSGPYDIDTLVADVAALVEHVGGAGARAVIVGHDWGGGVAWHFAATRGDLCRRLVVMNCPHPAVFHHALTHSWRQIRRSWYMFFFLLPLLPERFLTRRRARVVSGMFVASAVDRTNFSRDDLEPYREAMLRPGAASATLGWYRSALRKGLLDRRRFADYPSVEAPTLLIWGMEDFALGFDDVVPGTERFVRSLRIERIPSCGHFVQTETPARVNPVLLSFLAENGPAIRASA